MTPPLPRLVRAALLLAFLGAATPPACPPAAAAGDSAAVDEAPADAWPMFRGVLAGTGRSAARFRLPLAERWHRQLDKTAFDATPVIMGGRIFVGDLDGTFHCLALDDGRTLWTFKTDVGFPAAAAVSGDPAVVVVGDAAGMIRAFDAADGSLLWTHETGAEISGGPTLLPAEGGARVLVGSQDATLVCLSLADGGVAWKHTINDQIRCSPTVARTPDGERVFIAGCDGKLHIIDAVTGEATGAVPIDGPTGTTPAAADGRVFFGTEGGAFFAIDVLKREVAWRKQAGAAGQSYRSSAALADGLAIVGSRGRAVEAFSRADGERKWRLPLRGRVDAAPAVALATGPAADAGPARNVAIVADAAGTIVAIDVATGGPAWRFEAGGRFAAGPAIASGRVVIASEEGTVRCFRSAE